MLGVARLQLRRQLGVRPAVLGGVPLGLAAQPPELLARGRHTGLQELHQLLRTGSGGLPGGPVGPVGRLEQLRRARADLVAQPVQFGQGRALVALRTSLFGPQVGTDTHLLVQLGGGPIGLAERGQGRLGGVRVTVRYVVGGARDLGAFGPQRAGGATGVVGGPLSTAPVLVGGTGALQTGLGAGLRLGGLVGQFAQLDLPAGPFAQSVGQPGEGVGGAPGLLCGLLPLVACLRGLGGGFVGLGPHGARLGQFGLRLLGERACVPGGLRQLDEAAGRTAGTPGGEPGGQFTVLGEAGRERPDLLVPLACPRAQRLALLVGGMLVVHGRVRRYEEDVPAVRLGGRSGCEEGGRRTHGDGGPGKQCRVVQDLAGACVRVGVGDDHAIDQFRPCGQHARVVGGVDGLGEIAPAGQGGDAVLTEELDRGQHVRSRRQQPAVTERAEDA